MSKFTKKLPASFFPHWLPKPFGSRHFYLSRTEYHQFRCTALGSEGPNCFTNLQGHLVLNPKETTPQLSSCLRCSNRNSSVEIKYCTAEIAPSLCQQGEASLPGRILSWSYLLPFPVCLMLWHMKLLSKCPHVRLCTSLGCCPCWFGCSNSK